MALALNNKPPIESVYSQKRKEEKQIGCEKLQFLDVHIVNIKMEVFLIITWYHLKNNLECSWLQQFHKIESMYYLAENVLYL